MEDSLIASGNGWVMLVPLEREYQGGLNGGKMVVAVAVLTELRPFENIPEKNGKKMDRVTMCQDTMTDSITTSGSGWVESVPLERRDRSGSNGTNYNVAVAVLAELQWIKK
jgi:hypothetical protein